MEVIKENSHPYIGSERVKSKGKFMQTYANWSAIWAKQSAIRLKSLSDCYLKANLNGSNDLLACTLCRPHFYKCMYTYML